MASLGTAHTWICFQWDLTKEDHHRPLILDAKEQLIRDEQQFKDIIEEACRAVSKIQKAKDEIERLKRIQTQDRKKIRTPLADLSGANADLWLALGFLVAAQESEASEHADLKTVELTKAWREAVWDDLLTSSEEIAKHDNVQMYESPKPQGERWVGSWPLGSGAFGNTHLFIQQDAGDQICNRIVIKDCDYQNNGLWDAEDWFWLEDHRDRDIPVEVKTMADLRGRNGSEFIVKLLSWRMAKERRLYRLFCPLQDLYELMDKHWKRRRSPRDLFSIPEQFIWYMFESLCIAGLVLEHGEMERNPMGNWTSIVHRDMKLSNVFLSLPSETQYRCYPVPKLGDFGLAIYLTDGELSDQNNIGTYDNMPVEQDWSAMKEHGKTWSLTTKANVWGIANIVASLMAQKEGFGDWDRFRKNQEPVWYEWEAGPYSHALRGLIEECMRFDPNDRLDLAPVLKRIRARTLPRQNGSLPPLPIAPVYSPVWSGHKIDAEILDLSEAKTKIYRLSDPLDADYSTKIGGEAGTELAKVTPRMPGPANESSGREPDSSLHNPRTDRPGPTRRSNRVNSGSANTGTRKSGWAVGPSRRDYRSVPANSENEDSSSSSSSSSGSSAPSRPQQGNADPQFQQLVQRLQQPEQARTRASTPQHQSPGQNTVKVTPRVTRPTNRPSNADSTSALANTRTEKPSPTRHSSRGKPSSTHANAGARESGSVSRPNRGGAHSAPVDAGIRQRSPIRRSRRGNFSSALAGAKRPSTRPPPPSGSRSPSYRPSAPPPYHSPRFATLHSPLPSPYRPVFSPSPSPPSPSPPSPPPPSSPASPPPPPPPPSSPASPPPPPPAPSVAPQPAPAAAPQQAPQGLQPGPQPPQPTLASTRTRRIVKRKFSNLNEKVLGANKKKR